MKFNKDQREGLAKVLDNIATAFIIGVTIGSLADHKFSVVDTYMLFGFSVSLVIIAIGLRGLKEPENVN